MQWRSSRPSRDRGLQRHRVDRAGDPHPRPGSKLNLDRPVTGRMPAPKTPTSICAHRWIPDCRAKLTNLYLN
jgi:hypothetical protein